MSRATPTGYHQVRLLSRNHDYDVHVVRSDDRDCLCIAKSVRACRLDDAGATRRLLAEGRLLADLAHPHLVRAYEVVQRPRPTVILEVLPGATLSRLVVDRSRGFGVADLGRLGGQLCSVLGYLHRHGVLHLDVKPSNLVVAGGLLKVLDLALAGGPGPVPAGQGTPEYLAPEQACGGEVSVATDVWGLGGVLYRCATRRRPFPEAGEGHFPQVHRRVAPIGRRLPRGLKALVTGCLDPVPAARPTIAEAAAELRLLVPEAPAPR